MNPQPNQLAERIVAAINARLFNDVDKLRIQLPHFAYAPIVERELAQGLAEMEAKLAVAKDALDCAASVMGSHELQDSQWDGARDCVKIARAALTPSRAAKHEGTKL